MQMNNQEEQHANSTFFEKLYYAAFVVNVSADFDDLEPEFIWQIPYFLIGPCFSIYLSFVSYLDTHLYNISFTSYTAYSVYGM